MPPLLLNQDSGTKERSGFTGEWFLREGAVVVVVLMGRDGMLAEGRWWWTSEHGSQSV